MKRWTRWQDYVALAAGILLALTPLWSYPGFGAAWAMVVLGVLLAGASLWSLYDPGAIISEYAHAALGVLMFITPWVFAFTGTRVAAFTAWILGAIAVAMGLAAIPETKRAHQQIAH